MPDPTTPRDENAGALQHLLRRYRDPDRVPVRDRRLFGVMANVLGRAGLARARVGEGRAGLAWAGIALGALALSG